MRFPAWYKRLNRSVGKAICSYGMISEGDRIAVGISGGKDSLVLLSLLKSRMAYVPVRYDLVPMYVDPGFEPSPAPVIEAFCRNMGLTPKIILTDNGLVAHGPENRENPCFLCARLRRKVLFEATVASGCNKLALGHHKDDLIETFFINVLYAGQVCTMIPVQHFFQGQFTMIRPLAYSDESHIRTFAEKSGLPVVSNPCPSAHFSKRSEIKSLLNQLYRTNKKVRGNIFHALHHVNHDFMLSSGQSHLSAPGNANHTSAESIDPAMIQPPTENPR
ncbi:ATP-binding protein [Desulfatirhabdium butyrativorans]|uniref:ATP-binding protein n=1 Tax=Desulfatirhabdium butyrativorans TaxID=340467 RepID=UPI0003F70045|nr:ATP-binding protein [Desulfatirhabdium butyrativorans]